VAGRKPYALRTCAGEYPRGVADVAAGLSVRFGETTTSAAMLPESSRRPSNGSNIDPRRFHVCIG
jgi:hypothetical protein